MRHRNSGGCGAEAEAGGAGEPRTGGERHVPLLFWSAPVFRQWHQTQRKAGNTLLDARPVWAFRPTGTRMPVRWALHVSVEVAAEDGRVKADEVVIGRPYSAELTADELAALRADTAAHGQGPEERTYVEVTTYGELLAVDRVDWTTLGMVARALAEVAGRLG